MKPIPALPRVPLLGNLGAFRRDRVALLERVAAECGPIGAFHLGPQRLVVVSSPELARPVLIDHADAFEKGPTVRRFARPILGDGLLAVDNAAHKPHRRLVAPAFVPRQIAAHAGAMAADAERAARELPDGGEVDLLAEMTRLSLRIIGRTLFSVDLADEAGELSAAFSVVLHHVTDQIQSLVPWPRLGRRVRDAIARLDATLARMIDERRRGAPHDDLLSILVFSRDADGAALSDRQIRDEAMNLFVAGHETVANALAWTWHLLLEHPLTYERVCEEARAHLRGRTACEADLPSLPWALAALKESMRLYPPGHSLGRQASREVALGEHVLPAGALVIVSTYLIHRRAELYDEPLRFSPGRFLGGAEERLPKLAYLPFGAGPRVCIGAQLALVEAQLILATLAQRVRFEPLDSGPIAPELLVTMRPARPVRVRVHRR